jgi:hypothetical protein
MHRVVWALAAVVTALAAAWVWAPLRSTSVPSASPAPQAGERPSSVAIGESPGAFTCPMHPQVTSDDAQARCPLCGMRLVRRDPSWAAVTGGATTAPYPQPRGSEPVGGELRTMGFVTSDRGRLLVVADVDPGSAARLAIGQTARLDLGVTAPAGRVTSVEAVSSDTGAARVWLTFTDPALRPGMYGELRIDTGHVPPAAATRR